MRYILFLIVVGLTFNLNLLTAQEGLNNPKQKEECQLITQFESIQVSCNEFEFEPIVGLVIGFVTVNYHWDFGDGVTSLEQNPVHEYTEDGNYLVELTVTMVNTETGECCNSSQLIKIAINCNSPCSGSLPWVDINGPVLSDVPIAICGFEEGLTDPGIILVPFAILFSDVETTYTITTSVGSSLIETLDDGFFTYIAFTQEDIDNSGGVITITATGVNFPDCVFSIDLNISELNQDLLELCLNTVVNKCGNGICDKGENFKTCPIDCTRPKQVSSLEGRQSNPLSSLSISPNPTSSKVTIKFIPMRYVTGIVYITITSLDGKALKKFELKDNYQTTIDVSDLPNGTYSVSAIYNNQIFGAEKLVIQK